MGDTHLQDLGDSLSPDERDARLDALTRRGGGEVVCFGESVQGRPLVAARLPPPRTGAPRVLCAGNIHGVEFVGARVALGLLEALVERQGTAAELRERAEVWVAPCLNPDGYARTVAQGGRGTMKELRTNAHGVDLNRNFPRPGGGPPSLLPFTGSGDEAAATYRGRAELSEPETRAMDALLSSQRFHAVISLHSFMGTLIPARVLSGADYATYGRLCAAFRGAQTRRRYRRVSSRIVDAFTGELEDHAHHAYGAWACCVEVFPVFATLRENPRAPSLFWRFNPRAPGEYVANDVPGVTAYFLAALREPQPGPRV